MHIFTVSLASTSRLCLVMLLSALKDFSKTLITAVCFKAGCILAVT